MSQKERVVVVIHPELPSTRPNASSTPLDQHVNVLKSLT